MDNYLRVLKSIRNKNLISTDDLMQLNEYCDRETYNLFLQKIASRINKPVEEIKTHIQEQHLNLDDHICIQGFILQEICTIKIKENYPQLANLNSSLIASFALLKPSLIFNYFCQTQPSSEVTIYPPDPCDIGSSEVDPVSSNNNKVQFLGDQNCVNNAHSLYIKCAVNPKGNCSDCQHFEPTKTLKW